MNPLQKLKNKKWPDHLKIFPFYKNYTSMQTMGIFFIRTICFILFLISLPRMKLKLFVWQVLLVFAPIEVSVSSNWFLFSNNQRQVFHLLCNWLWVILWSHSTHHSNGVLETEPRLNPKTSLELQQSPDAGLGGLLSSFVVWLYFETLGY